ncbi:MAG: DNA repair protein RecN [Eubacteriales bacterium]|nr:DNA repair protein RecN [Eubacteriales bacterium]
MLLHLHVKNLALIREAEIDFSEGLNILTGETGAGKSILIGSMTMALGGKVSRELVREGADYALSELVFDTQDPRILQALEEMGAPAEDGQIILSRRISGSRSICRLNGETVSASTLKEAASLLIDIHGQHEHQSLLNKKKHLEILDEYAHQEMGQVKEELKKRYEACRKLKEELERLSMDESARMREQSLLEFELQEIGEAGLQEGEDAALEQSYRRMSNSRRIMEALGAVRQLCAEGEPSASELIGRACRELQGIARLDEEAERLNGQLQELDSMLADFDRELERSMEDMEFSEEDFQRAEERLNQINHLKAKYGPTIPEILEAAGERRERLELLADLDLHRERTGRELREAQEELAALCRQAHDIRERAASRLGEQMREQLSELNFLDVRFEIAVRETEQPGADGWDDVEFLISANPGEPLKPLGKIASGGELSRIMLAIKTVLADQDAIGTVIFDEIDTGISGRTAQRVSEKLAVIGRSRQVICITHLAQLAAMADSHYCIEKSAEDGVTQTRIRKLKEQETTEELARILGGAQITGAVLDNAREMKKLAHEYKTSNHFQ